MGRLARRSAQAATASWRGHPRLTAIVRRVASSNMVLTAFSCMIELTCRSKRNSTMADLCNGGVGSWVVRARVRVC